jgi:heme-degrading monooxygenase HmoA
MYVIVSSIRGPAPVLAVMAEAFRQAVPDLWGLEGFLGFEIWREDGALHAVSKWTDKDASLVHPRSGVFERHIRSAASAHDLMAAQVKTYEAEVLA